MPLTASVRGEDAMRISRIIVGALAVFAMSFTVVAQQRRPGQQQRPGLSGMPGMTEEQSPAQNENAQVRHTPPPPEEKTVVTHHSARIGGQQMNYTATVGTYVVRADDDTPKATFFYVAYTKDDVPDITQRPVSFVYNGGPGSASLFTHMGMGPKRVVLTADGHGMAAPYHGDGRRGFVSGCHGPGVR